MLASLEPVTLRVPFKSQRIMIGAKQNIKMKENAVPLNASRGGKLALRYSLEHQHSSRLRTGRLGGQTTVSQELYLVLCAS